MTKPKDTPLARRRKVARDLAAVEADAPIAFVEAPIHTVLANVQRVVATEIAFMEEKHRGGDMPVAEAKKLANLVGALEKTIAIGSTVNEREFAKMDDAELERALLDELEAIRARRLKP